jgi:hypothetical protein
MKQIKSNYITVKYCEIEKCKRWIEREYSLLNLRKIDATGDGNEQNYYSNGVQTAIRLDC